MIISEWNESDIHAISFFVESNKVSRYKSFENASLFAISYNIESDCMESGQYNEERWNYAYWRQNEIFIIDPDYETELTDLLFNWYVENGLDNIGEELEDSYNENG